MQRTLAASAGQLQHKCSRNTKMVTDVAQKQKQIEKLHGMIKSAKEHLQHVTLRSTSASDRARYLEEMIQVRHIHYLI